MVLNGHKSFHRQYRKICIYYLDAGHPLYRALLLLLRRPLPALNLDYNHDGDDEDDDDDDQDDLTTGGNARSELQIPRDRTSVGIKPLIR